MTDLEREIEYIKRQARKISKNSAPEKTEEIKHKYFESEFQNMINNHFRYLSTSEIYRLYSHYFHNKKLPFINIKKGQKNFFRARIGYNTIWGSEKGISKEFIFPYYDDEISAPPSLLATSGRFNHEGVPCLYLSDRIETCISEIRLQVGQKCTISEFECINDLVLIDLTKLKNNIEMQCWLKLLTEPIHSEVLYKYNITRFLASVLKGVNDTGLYIKSTQSEGNNIICYKDNQFKPIKYSSRIYTAKRITYDYDVVEDSIDEYITKGTDEINSYNDNRSEKFMYLLNWIKHKRQ